MATTSINGWVAAACPEFEVSVCGSDINVVKEDLYDMIIKNALVNMRKEKTKGVNEVILAWSKVIAAHQESVPEFFKNTYQK